MDQREGLPAGVQEELAPGLRFNLINVLNNGVTVEFDKFYCYKTVQKKFIVGSSFCRSLMMQDASERFFDKVEEAVDYILTGRNSGKTG
jgi:hypothetical protein